MKSDMRKIIFLRVQFNTILFVNVLYPIVIETNGHERHLL